MNRKQRRLQAKKSGGSSKKDKAAGLLAEAQALAQAGNPSEALSVCETALKLDRHNTDIHYVTGVLCKQLGQVDAAISHYRKAIALQPAHVHASYNLGNLLMQENRIDEACAAYRQAVRFNPNMAMAWNNLGNLLKTTGQTAEAEAAYQKSTEVEPHNPDAWFNLGEIRRGSGRLKEAVETFEKVLELAPGHVTTLNHLGVALRDMKDLETSASRLRQAVQLAPELAMGHVNLGNTLRELGQFDSAYACFEAALERQPDNPGAHTNFANLLEDMGRLDMARLHFDKALSLDPDSAEGHYNLGLLDLLEGKYAGGWTHFNRRWMLDDFRRVFPTFDKPLWQGEPLAGKTLLLWDEQGVGDAILMSSMIPDLLERGGQVQLHCEPRLIPLMTRAFPTLTCVAKAEGNQVQVTDAKFDFHLPLGNLGGLLRPQSDCFPASASFLSANPAQTASLRQRYRQNTDNRLVGIAWHSVGPDSGPKKSISLAALKPVLEIPGVTFVDLQYGDTRSQRAAFAAETGIDILHDEDLDQMDDLDGFAAQTAAMDLVVTISNSTAHMAGSLGVPTFVLLNHVPIWYWGLARDACSWYPALRLFRQSEAGRWDDVIASVAAAVRQQLQAG